MFDAIAGRYDLLNRVMSFGLDQGWRRRAVASLELTDGQRVLDVAAGTGDLSILVARAAEIDVVALDPSSKMLAEAAAKVSQAGLTDRVTVVTGDAQALPFDGDSFDACTIAFGIRNVPDRALGLREMVRVIRPGGRIAILELSEPSGGLLAPFAKVHIRQVVPRLGALLSGSKEYRYLQTSVAAFPRPDMFVEMMQANGFREVESQALSFSACVLYTGVV